MCITTPKMLLNKKYNEKKSTTKQKVPVEKSTTERKPTKKMYKLKNV